MGISPFFFFFFEGYTQVFREAEMCVGVCYFALKLPAVMHDIAIHIPPYSYNRNHVGILGSNQTRFYFLLKFLSYLI